jgi:GNAT superfamily N-acetyltransferase
MKLHRLYLHSDLHGTGVAKALMNWLETEAIAKNLDFIWLEAMEQKQQAKVFYEKMGYQLALTYQLEFDLLKPEFRGIHIYKKKIKH